MRISIDTNVTVKISFIDIAFAVNMAYIIASAGAGWWAALILPYGFLCMLSGANGAVKSNEINEL